MKIANIVWGGIVVLLCIVGWVHVDAWPNVQATGLHENFYPKVLFSVTALCGLGLFVQGVRNTPSDPFIPFCFRTLLPFLAATAAYAWAIEYFGFIGPTAAFMAAGMLCFGERRLKVLIPVALLCSIGIFYVFTEAFQIVLPEFDSAMLPWAS